MVSVNPVCYFLFCAAIELSVAFVECFGVLLIRPVHLSRGGGTFCRKVTGHFVPRFNHFRESVAYSPSQGDRTLWCEVADHHAAKVLGHFVPRFNHSC